MLRIVAPDRIASVPIEHFERAYGSSNYTLKKLIGLWSNIAGFSIVPLRIAKRCGIGISALGLIGTIVLLIRKLVHPAAVLGWTSMIVAIFFFSGILLFTIGMVGEYVGRMFLAMGNYPQYVVREVHTGDPGRMESGGAERIISGR